MNKLTFSQSVDGYLLAAQARRLSPHTIQDYQFTLRRFAQFLGDDPPIEDVTSKHVEGFLAGLAHVSKKTLLNYHIGLSALWTWLVAEEIVPVHVVRKVRAPRPEKKEVQPYTQAEVKELLGALKYSRSYSRPRKGETRHSLPHQERNRAIIYLLLDTGLRAEELSTLRIHQVDMKNRRVTVMGKGSKQRSVPFSAKTGQVLWRYLATRKEASAADPMFVTTDGRPMDRCRLLRALTVIGGRAGVQGVNVHRFRHTFAINYLRNGGDAYSLQMMLGHSTMEMVKRYLALSQVDLDAGHKIASPVERWML